MYAVRSRYVGFAGVFMVALVVGTMDAGEIAYYRFENSPGFLSDSSGNGNSPLTNTGATQVALPGSGRGSTFFDPIPPTGAANDSAAEFDGSEKLEFLGLSSAPTTAFTVEGFFHWDDGPESNESFADILAVGHNAGAGMFAWQIRTDGFNGTDPDGELFLFVRDEGDAANEFFNSGFNTGNGLGLDTDYYFALVFDDTNPTVDFLVQDLTNGGALQTFSVANTISAGGLLANADDLQIGNGDIFAAASAFDFDGLIDEFRYSDTALSLDELLIAAPPPPPPLAPEPSTFLLFAVLVGLTVGHVIWRSRRAKRSA